MYSGHQEIESANELVRLSGYALPAPAPPSWNKGSKDFQTYIEHHRSAYFYRHGKCVRRWKCNTPSSQIIIPGLGNLQMVQTTTSKSYRTLLTSLSSPRLSRMSYHKSEIDRRYVHDPTYVRDITRGFIRNPNLPLLEVISSELWKFQFPNGSQNFHDLPLGESLHYMVLLSSGDLRPGLSIYDGIEQDIDKMNIVGANKIDSHRVPYQNISIAIALPGLGFPQGFAVLKFENLTRAQALREICHKVNDHLDGLKCANKIATYFNDNPEPANETDGVLSDPHNFPRFPEGSDQWKILQNLEGLHIFSLIHITSNKYVLDIGLKCRRPNV